MAAPSDEVVTAPRRILTGARTGLVPDNLHAFFGRPLGTSHFNNTGSSRANLLNPNNQQETSARPNVTSSRNVPVNNTGVGGTNSPASNGHQAGAAALARASAGDRNSTGTTNQAGAPRAAGLSNASTGDRNSSETTDQASAPRAAGLSNASTGDRNSSGATNQAGAPRAAGLSNASTGDRNSSGTTNQAGAPRAAGLSNASTGDRNSSGTTNQAGAPRAAGLSNASTGDINSSGTTNQASAPQANNNSQTESGTQEQGAIATFEGLCMCPICHEVINGTNITRCGHRFCGHCILQWLQDSTDCPVCRRRVHDIELIQDNTFDEVIGMLRAQLEQQPLTTERSIELNEISEGIANIRQEATGFTDRIEDYIQNLEQYERTFRNKEAEMNHLQVAMNHLQAQNQTLTESQTQLSGDLEAARKEIERLHLEVFRLRAFELLCADKDAELKKLNTEVLPTKQAQLDKAGAMVLQYAAANAALQEEVKSLKSQIEALELDVINQSDKHERALNDNRRILADLQRQSEKLAKITLDRNNLKQQCLLMETEWRHLKEEIIPNKDSVNEELRQKNTDLQNELDYLKRNVRLLNDVPESKLYHSLVKLQHFYDRDYRTKIAITENMVNEMHALLEVATCELLNNKDVEGKMAEAISSHLSLIEENSNLHETASQNSAEILRLKTQVRVLKERVLSLQKKFDRTNEERSEE